MIIYEFKVKGKDKQYRAIDDAIRTSQFIQNKALRYWMDNKKVGRYDLNKYCAVLAAEFSFADELNSMARQSAAVGEAFPKGTCLECDISVLRELQEEG
jgi:putative transposase